MATSAPFPAPAARRPRAAALLIALLPLAGCGGEAPPAETGGEELLWETPELPTPWLMTVDGREVTGEVLIPYLEGEWNEYCAAEDVQPGGVLAALEGFTADPEARFGALVGDVLLLWEGERRFPELDLVELQEYRRRMEAATGASTEILIKKLGEDGFQRFLQRRYRLELTMDALAGELPEPSVDELMADYAAAVEGIEVPEGVEGPSFEQLEPQLRASWRKRHWAEAGLTWIAAAREGVVAKVVRPDATTIEIPAP